MLIASNLRKIAYKLTFLLMFVFAVILTGCSSTNPQAGKLIKEDIKSLPGALWQDSKKLITQPENQVVLLLGAGGSGYFLCAEDDRVASHFEGHNSFPRDFTIAAGAIPYTEVALTGAGYLYTTLTGDEHRRKVCWATLEALALNGIYTGGLKLIANNHSPNGEGLAWPSGHTSTSVTFATVLNEFYGPWVGMPLYALSGLVMYERMDTEEHWASDVVFGAALGYVVGHTVAAKYKPEIFEMTILPFFDIESGASGIAFAKRF